MMVENMGILVDVLLLLIFIYFIIMGKKKGFIRTLLLVVSKLASFLLAKFISSEYSALVYESFFKELTVNRIESYLKDGSLAELLQNVSRFFGSVPEYYLKTSHIQSFDVSVYSDQLTSLDVIREVAMQLEENVIGPFLIVLCSALVFIIVFVLSSILFSIIIKVICKFFKLPVLKTVDGVLGAFLGSLNGFVCVLILSFLLIVCSLFITSEYLQQTIDSSYFINLLTKISF